MIELKNVEVKEILTNWLFIKDWITNNLFYNVDLELTEWQFDKLKRQIEDISEDIEDKEIQEYVIKEWIKFIKLRLEEKWLNTFSVNYDYEKQMIEIKSSDFLWYVALYNYYMTWDEIKKMIIDFYNIKIERLKLNNNLK